MPAVVQIYHEMTPADHAFATFKAYYLKIIFAELI
jgi:hypothetical protein